METRPYFVVGDIISNLAAGALVGGVCALVLPPGWNMVAAMVVGMAIGTVISLPVAFLFTGPFGAMEIQLPVMLTGMVAGMATATQSSLMAMAFTGGARLGAICGFGVLVATYVANALLKARAQRWTT